MVEKRKEMVQETRLQLHLLANVLDASSRHGHGGAAGWVHRLVWMTSDFGVARG